MFKGFMAGGNMVHSINCKEASVVKHKGTREPCEDDQSHGILWAVVQVPRFYPKNNRKSLKQRRNMISF